MKFQNYDKIYAHIRLEIVFIIVNSADPDVMPPYVAFHLGLNCFPTGDKWQLKTVVPSDLIALVDC